MPFFWSDCRLNDDVCPPLNAVFRSRWPSRAHHATAADVEVAAVKLFGEFIAENNLAYQRTSNADPDPECPMLIPGWMRKRKRGWYRHQEPVIPVELHPEPIVKAKLEVSPDGWRSTFLWVQVLTKAAAMRGRYRRELLESLNRKGAPGEGLKELPSWARTAILEGWGPPPFWMP